MGRHGITFEAPIPVGNGKEEPGKSDREMVLGREQRERLFKGLDYCKPMLAELIGEAVAKGASEFSIDFSVDLSGQGKITQQRVADSIRLWTFENYRGVISLKDYDPKKKSIAFQLGAQAQNSES